MLADLEAKKSRRVHGSSTTSASKTQPCSFSFLVSLCLAEIFSLKGPSGDFEYKSIDVFGVSDTPGVLNFCAAHLSYLRHIDLGNLPDADSSPFQGSGKEIPCSGRPLSLDSVFS